MNSRRKQTIPSSPTAAQSAVKNLQKEKSEGRGYNPCLPHLTYKKGGFAPIPPPHEKKHENRQQNREFAVALGRA